MAALLISQFFTPDEIIMKDMDDNRLNLAKFFGANFIINGSNENAVDKVMSLTNRKGVDVAINSVGLPATFEICEVILAPDGHLANIRVHG